MATIIEIMQSLTKHPNVNVATFAVPAPIEVSGVGELRVLAELCRRLSRPGALIDEILADLREQEELWLMELQRALGDADRRTTALRLHRFRVKFIGDEESLRELLRERLETRFPSPVDPLIAGLTEYFAAVDGSVESTYEVLDGAVLKSFPRIGAGNFDDVYLAIIDQIENRLWVKGWSNLSDALIRNLLPTAFATDIGELSFLMSVQPWPGTRLELEKEMKNVATRARSYIDCFMSNYELAREDLFRENLAYKRKWNPKAYELGGRRSDEWDKECLKRLYNLVVALNSFARVVRETVNSRYRMTDGGDFAIVDSTGFRDADMQPARYRPTEYRDEAPLTLL
ncbi:MAG: hypothetical protein INH41_03170 [Myxococcaceae bacterium]|nr:hypothetical protein [Myxococcaceae bacterium]